MATLLQTHRVSPPPPPPHGGELTLPLTFFDMFWVHFHPIRRVLFYDHPCSASDFLNAVVPNLKQSLSLTLKHFLPAAGNLLYPNDTDKNMPLLRYAAGDSVQLTIAESGLDFDELTASCARESDQFYDFVPELPPVKDDGDYKLAPLMAVQATLFPGRGIALGIVHLHCLGDGRSVNAGLIFGWASINKFGGDEEFLKERGESLPIFDRSLIKDVDGINTIFWNQLKHVPFKLRSFPLPTNRVRATFALTRSDIEMLKNRVRAKKSGLDRVSSFVVAAGYAWSCMAKSEAADGDDDAEAEELFVIPADVRGRRNALIEPPVPANYFGNCIGFAVARVRRGELAGEGGFEAAAEAVAEEIKNGVDDAAGLLKGAGDWISEVKKCKEMKMRCFGVAGSPKFDVAAADFGWGKARKLENLTLDAVEYTMWLGNAGAGGLEFGLPLPKKRMEAFAAVFADGLIE
ncbi:malonyl-coenzyme:anthocyanin 5-O-glucoside-6'''-O-malonyltransferase-like [Salvia miltiorrhiza]|uniref:malonyl-coenzyme:anthocyanin 5-O-glucoside-6'''-O-malonyltransferase-like n=1 Tax=Salvia miltiorrhiza TaxID=226208 RepID=UPI0025AC239A|nr:malonyl-coenzyme:anthocyanin 5-O-glucoside-6'''-O-malonyltransferase-like [Salvia miltiorrhiza]